LKLNSFKESKAKINKTAEKESAASVLPMFGSPLLTLGYLGYKTISNYSIKDIERI